MPYLGRAPTGTGSVTKIDGDLKVTGQLTAQDTLFKMTLDGTDGSSTNAGDNFLIEDGGTDGSGTDAGDDICIEKDTTYFIPGQNILGTLSSGIAAGDLTGLPEGFTFTEVAAQATTSGSSVDFTIPSGAKRFIVLLNGVSNNGNSSAMGIQLGDAGGIETSAYGCTAETIGGYEHDTGMFQISKADQTDNNLNFYGLLTFETLVGSSDLTWIGNGNYGSSSIHRHGTFGGYKTISAELTTVRFKTDGTFDAGSVSVRWASA